MSKLPVHKRILLVAMVLFVSVVGLATPHLAHAGWLDGIGNVISFVVSPIVVFILGLANLLAYITGTLLNNVVDWTVVKMSANLASGTGGTGLGNAINATWGTVRDVANMLFIFVLLYTAIMTIFGEGNYKEVIKNLVIAALLINFSLFFTKVIIDAANLLSLLFYKSIAPDAFSPGATILSGGLSNTFNKYLGLTHLVDLIHGADTTMSTLTTNALLSAVVLVIASFIFVAVAIMFVIRYVVLIMVLILSPLMFLSYILPKGVEGSNYSKKWWDALIGQAFFAPAYFFMTWISLKVIYGIQQAQAYVPNWNFAGTTSLADQTYATSPDPGIINTVLDFGIIIAFLIASILIAKSVSDRAGSGVKSMTKWATGTAGGLTLGMAGRLGRGTVGRAGAALGDNETLKDTAARGNLVTSRLARLSLAAGRKTSAQSFDIRGTGVGKTLDAGNAQKGGFAADMKNKIDNEKKYADSLKPSDLVIADAKDELDKSNNADMRDPKMVAAWREDKEKLTNEARKAQRELASAQNKVADADTITELRRKVKEANEKRNKIERIKDYKQYRIDNARANVDKLEGVDEKEARERVQEATGKSDAQMKDYVKEKEGKQAIKDAQQKSTGTLRKEAYAEDLGTSGPFSFFDRVGFIGKVKRENRAAALAIRKSVKEKSASEKATEAITALAKEQAEAEKTAGTTTPTPPPTPPTGGTGTTPLTTGGTTP